MPNAASTSASTSAGPIQDVEMATGSLPPAAGPSTAVPGKRAKLTETALLAACSKVMKKHLTDKNMLQCFPEFAIVFEEAYGKEEGKQHFTTLMKGLKDMVETHFNAGVPLAWADMCSRYQFVERANDLDRIQQKATQAKERGDPPRNLYIIGADGQITMPNATVPVLRDAAAELRAKRSALAERNAATFDRISQTQANVAQTEAQIQSIIDDFAKSMQVLQGIDMEQVLRMQEQLSHVMPIDRV